MPPKHEYHEGPKARDAFNKGMSKLFQVRKAEVDKKSPQPKPKRKKSSKD